MRRLTGSSLLPLPARRLESSFSHTIARRGSNEAEETAQVAGVSDGQGKDGDEEAGAHNAV
ncbi:unnamed protein product [Urochloa decumbens]|uniref:Uncharacterized protein n=1 Tax=Urochloa decumbens TaxID=240449 RepID=A0ABC9BKA7_9POAL